MRDIIFDPSPFKTEKIDTNLKFDCNMCGIYTRFLTKEELNIHRIAKHKYDRCVCGESKPKRCSNCCCCFLKSLADDNIGFEKTN